MEKLTICVCSFNSEKYIFETLESLFSQTYKNWDLYIIDDCSTDHSKEVIEEILDKHPEHQSKLVSLPENSGTAYARQYALEHVDTPLMLFFDADDIAKPDFVAKLYRTITADEDLIAVSCYCDYMDAEGHPLKGGIYLGPTSKEAYTAIFRRDYALKAGGYRQAQWFPVRNDGIRYQDMSEDVDLWGRMSDFYKEGKSILVLPETLFYYRKNTNSLSTGFSKARVMGQKLLYIKANLKRRRANLKELTFDEFWQQLAWWKKLNFERRNGGAYFYRCACFDYVKKKYIRCVLNLCLGALCSPFYPMEKYKANFRKKK